MLATAQVVHAARIDIEAENPLECNVELRKDGPSNTFSRGYRLILNSDSPIRVKYEFVAPEEGTYTLRIREYFPNGRSPLRWRVDDGEWHAVKQGWDLMQTQVENSMVYSEWGQVELKKGEHILEIETTGPVMRRRPVTQDDQWYSSAAVMEAMDHRMQTDVLIFTTEPLVPTAELARLYRETGAYQPYASATPGSVALELPPRSRASQTWAMLIKRVYELDPLACPKCGGEMKVVAFIEPPQADAIEKILRHCGLWNPSSPRGPPADAPSVHAPDALRDFTYVDIDTFESSLWADL